MAIQRRHERAWRGSGGRRLLHRPRSSSSRVRLGLTRGTHAPAAEGLLRASSPPSSRSCCRPVSLADRHPHASARRARLLSLAAAVAGGHELAVIFGAGAIGRSWPGRASDRAGRANACWLCRGRGGLAATTLASRRSPHVPVPRLPEDRLVLFGSGYVLLAFLRADLAVRRGWLTEDSSSTRSRGPVTPGRSSRPPRSWATSSAVRGAVVATSHLPPRLRVVP